jgi:hypothetical protein
MAKGETGWSGVMFTEKKPATEYRIAIEAPRSVFFCPDCEWRVGEFAENQWNAEVTRFEGATPGEIYGWLLGGIIDAGDDDALKRRRHQPRRQRRRPAERAL